MLFKIITVLIFHIPTCLPQIIGKKCSAYNVNVVQNFDLNQYLGKWYEYERYETFFQLGMRCVTASYSLNSKKNVTVINRGKLPFIGINIAIPGKAFPADPDSKEAKLKVSFFPIVPPGDYWVIGTDYERYSVVWACTGIFQFLWVLVRDLNKIDEIEPTVNEIIDKAGLNRFWLKKTQTDRKICGVF